MLLRTVALRLLSSFKAFFKAIAYIIAALIVLLIALAFIAFLLAAALFVLLLTGIDFAFVRVHQACFALSELLFTAISSVESAFVKGLLNSISFIIPTLAMVVGLSLVATLLSNAGIILLPVLVGLLGTASVPLTGVIALMVLGCFAISLSISFIAAGVIFLNKNEMDEEENNLPRSNRGRGRSNAENLIDRFGPAAVIACASPIITGGVALISRSFSFEDAVDGCTKFMSNLDEDTAQKFKAMGNTGKHD